MIIELRNAMKNYNKLEQRLENCLALNYVHVVCGQFSGRFTAEPWFATPIYEQLADNTIAFSKVKPFGNPPPHSAFRMFVQGDCN